MTKQAMYRGERVDGKGMVKGWYAKRYMPADDEEPSDVIYEADGLFPVEVIPASVAQSTGLKDSVGVEIYEGDTLLNKKGGHRWLVVWDKKHAKFGYAHLTGILIDERCTLGDSDYAPKQIYEVIGNITDTPAIKETKG